MVIWVNIKPPGIGPQVLVHISTYQGKPFGVPIDTHPFGKMGIFHREKMYVPLDGKSYPLSFGGKMGTLINCPLGPQLSPPGQAPRAFARANGPMALPGR